MNKLIIEDILSETEQGYDLISGKFSETRKSFWKELNFIADYSKKGDKVLDYGCGNGRLLEIIREKQIEYIGADVSEELLKLARSSYSGADIEFIKLDPIQSSLPFKADFFNTVYSIAVFHHLPDKDHRMEIVKELHRVLKPGGYVVVTVWNLWQSNYRRSIFKNWKKKLLGKSLSPHQFSNKILNILFLNNLRLYIRKFICDDNWCRDDLEWNDCRIQFKDNQGRVFSRFHHAFTLGELKRLFSSAGFEIEKAEIVEKRNLLLIAKK